jgi:hypothetical protein
LMVTSVSLIGAFCYTLTCSTPKQAEICSGVVQRSGVAFTTPTSSGWVIASGRNFSIP